jgi:hypothetical protein
LTRNACGVTLTAQMDKLTAPKQWKTALFMQGRSLKWLAAATGYKARTVYAYSSGQHPATAEFLAKVAEVLGEEVSA